MRRQLLGALALSTTLSLVMPASAEQPVVIGAPIGTYIPFPVIEYQGGGPITLVPGIVWTSSNTTTNGGSWFGHSGHFDFVDNGSYDGVAVSSNNTTSVTMPFEDYYLSEGAITLMQFTFTRPVRSFGAYFNWSKALMGTSIQIESASVEAGWLNETLTLALEGVNTWPTGFVGYQAPNAQMAYFQIQSSAELALLGGVYVDFGVPEPTTWTLAILGFGLAGSRLRRQRKGEREAFAAHGGRGDGED